MNPVGEELESTLQPLFHMWPASLCFKDISMVNVPAVYPILFRSVRVFERETRPPACSHPYGGAKYRTKSSPSSFFPRIASLWNSLPGACFPSSYDLPSVKRNINFYLQLLRFCISMFSPKQPFTQSGLVLNQVFWTNVQFLLWLHNN